MGTGGLEAPRFRGKESRFQDFGVWGMGGTRIGGRRGGVARIWGRMA